MNPLITTYAALGGAIMFEVLGTTFLQKSEQFTKLVPTMVTACSYAMAFYLMTVALRVMPVGIVYAIWSGLGIVLISLVGYFVFRQTLDFAAVIGLGLIVAGVVVINVFSRSVMH